MTECLLDAAFLFFECLLDPGVLEQLTTGSQEVVGEKEDRLGSGTDLRAFIVGESSCPILKLCDLIVFEHDEGSSRTQYGSGAQRSERFDLLTGQLLPYLTHMG